MATGWGDEEISIVAQGYFLILRNELVGVRLVKEDVYREMSAKGLTMQPQNIKDWCARISEQLEERGLPWVKGYSPPALVGRSPTSGEKRQQIWRVIEPLVATQFGVGELTEDRGMLDERAAHMTWITSSALPPAGHLHPAKAMSHAEAFLRDPAVVRYVRLQAAGSCELCGVAAPFLCDDAQPYLEVHHVKTLANGGSDRISNAVALCPNCHRRCHLGVDRAEGLELLYAHVARLRPE
jgi:5-methylcytosine-specific restriction protein A